MPTEVKVYFPYTLNFDDIVSQPVRLNGVIVVSKDEFALKLVVPTSKDKNENKFLINSSDGKNDEIVLTGFFPDDKATKSISEPFGMTGIVLENFGIRGSIKKNNGKTETDITLTAAARFPKLENLFLEGKILFEQTSPRLVVVTLSAQKPLTIKHFVESVIDGTWDWADDITDEFAFQSGEMYYLKHPDKAPDNYTFSYLDQTYKHGYHLQAKLQIFQEHDFLIGLDVEDKAITLQTTVPKQIDFDFITLDNPNLEISTKSPNKYLRISTKITILKTSIPSSISAEYNFGKKKAFVGAVSVNLGSLNLPTKNGNTSQNVQLGIEFTWTKGSGSNSSFKITKIDGLPTNNLNLIEDFLKVLNELRNNGCEKILKEWLNSLTKTVLTPGLNGSPSKTKDDKMKLPLKLRYEIKANDSVIAGSEITIASSEITFDAIFTIPSSLEDLPRAMWQSIVESSLQIAGDILADPKTYEAVSLEASKRGGVEALARFICRITGKKPPPLSPPPQETAPDNSPSGDSKDSEDSEDNIFNIPRQTFTILVAAGFIAVSGAAGSIGPGTALVTGAAGAAGATGINAQGLKKFNDLLEKLEKTAKNPKELEGFKQLRLSIYASLGIPSYATVGKSYVGINTRIQNKQL
ncbi:MAG: hypothetical protein VKL42_15315 [Snowella sp.]|nr:hypothetical protein [Snowella sp.]